MTPQFSSKKKQTRREFFLIKSFSNGLKILYWLLGDETIRSMVITSRSGWRSHGEGHRETFFNQEVKEHIQSINTAYLFKLIN